MKKELAVGDNVVVPPLGNVVGEITKITKAKVAWISITKRWGRQHKETERTFKFHVNILTKSNEKDSSNISS